jgi:hypothetical protein
VIIDLLTALRLSNAEGDALRHKGWMSILGTISAELKDVRTIAAFIEYARNVHAVPSLVITCRVPAETAARIIKTLIA